MIRIGFTIMVSIMSGILLLLITHLGVFKSVKFHEASLGNLQFAYLNHIGPYHKIVGTLEEVEDFFLKAKLDCSKSFGRFIDDPKLVDENHLKSQVGCKIEQKISNSDLNFLKANNIKILNLEPQKYIKAEFAGAPSIGPFKVYPKITKWIKKNNKSLSGPIIEVYKRDSLQKNKDKKITTSYLFPVK